MHEHGRIDIILFLFAVVADVVESIRTVHVNESSFQLRWVCPGEIKYFFHEWKFRVNITSQWGEATSSVFDEPVFEEPYVRIQYRNYYCAASV